MHRAWFLGLLVCVAGCDMFGEYETRKQETRQRLMSGGAAPAPAGQPADPNAAAQPMPMPMPMPVMP